MTRTTLLALTVTLAGAAALPPGAQAQFPSGGTGYSTPSSRPFVSPYLNLLRAGNSPGFNYFTLVRPQFEAQAAANQLRFQTSQNQQAISALQQQGTTGALVTGHQVGFMTHLSYFQSLGGAGGGPGFTIAAGGGQGFQGGASRGSSGGGRR